MLVASGYISMGLNPCFLPNTVSIAYHSWHNQGNLVLPNEQNATSSWPVQEQEIQCDL